MSGESVPDPFAGHPGWDPQPPPPVVPTPATMSGGLRGRRGDGIAAVMHDIRLIREDPAAFEAALARRGLAPSAAELVSLDERRVLDPLPTEPPFRWRWPPSWRATSSFLFRFSSAW